MPPPSLRAEHTIRSSKEFSFTMEKLKKFSGTWHYYDNKVKYCNGEKELKMTKKNLHFNILQ